MELTEAPESEAAESVDVDLESGSETVESELGESEAAEIVETPDPPADPFSEFGGREEIERAHRLYEASRTVDGQIELMIQVAQALNVPLSKVQALFEAGEPEEQPDPDEPLTRGEFQEQLRRQQEAERARQYEAAIGVARKAVADTLKDLGIEAGSQQAQMVLFLGNKHVAQDSLDPEEIRSAVRRGHDEYLAQVEADSKAYLAKKRQKGAGVPSSPSGAAAPSTPPEPEPADVAEAIARARKKLRAG